MIRFNPARWMSAIACLLLALTLTADAALAQRTGSRQQNRRQNQAETRGDDVRVTPEKEAAIFHAMLALSGLEGDLVGPVIGGGNAVVVCDDCGPWPGDPETCADLRQKVHDAAKANLDAQKLLDYFQALMEAYYQWQFWGGVGDMVTDMVAAATTILTAGTATGAVIAGAEILVEMGANASVGALQDALADQFGIDLSTETALADALAAFNDARKESHQAYMDALNAWLDCLGRREQAMAQVDAWNACWETRQCWIEIQ